MSHDPAPVDAGGECGRGGLPGSASFVYYGPCCLLGTWSEQYRHECEAERILRLPSRAARKEWLDAIEKRRGAEARRALEKTILRRFRNDRV